VHDAAKGLVDVSNQYMRGDMQSVLKSGLTLFKKITHGKTAREYSKRVKSSSADVIQFSGCKDDQTSSDTTEAV
jgi:metacaspase-1